MVIKGVIPSLNIHCIDGNVNVEIEKIRDVIKLLRFFL